MEPMTATALVAKYRTLDRTGAWGKPTTIILLKKHGNKMSPSDILL